ncbi:MAG: type II toxin-antitoxin system HigB family toxin [Desulfobacteraceae bacterium]|nr:type II toxin-antitoxin system HigB family toxin [Desulfobacteraceae bacterium]
MVDLGSKSSCYAECEEAQGDTSYFIFDINGNNVQLSGGTDYHTQIVFSKMVMTHPESDKRR